MAIFVGISALTWADQLAAFAMYVMMNYFTNVWNLSTTHAAGIINIWNGITPILAIMFAFFVDAFTGDFFMLVVSSIAYSVGLGLLSMSTPAVFGPCEDDKKECIGHTQKFLFYIALLLIAVGMAGHMVSLPPFLDLQTKSDEDNKEENVMENENRKEKKSRGETEEGNKIFMQIPGLIMVMIVIIAGGIGLRYVKPWKLRFGIPAICSVVATLLFFTGWPYYDRDPPKGSPLTTTVRVFVATVHNISKPIPNRKDLYYEDDTRPTSSLRCLDKAAIKLSEGQPRNKWKVCNVHEVEDTKIGIRMLPVWLTFIVVGIVLSIGNTYYLEQANHMDRKLGKIEVSIPIFLLFYNATSSISATSYHRYLTYFTNGVLGLGSMASVLSVYVVGKISERNGKPNWFQWVLAALSAVNLVIYVIVAYFYKYKESPDGGADEDIPEGGDMKDDFHDKNCCC